MATAHDQAALCGTTAEPSPRAACATINATGGCARDRRVSTQTPLLLRTCSRLALPPARWSLLPLRVLPAASSWRFSRSRCILL